MHKVFIGYDPRQAISYNVLQSSLVARSSEPLQITPLVLETLPITRKGLTPFTYTRFLVPYLCDYEGWALFMDADMLVLDDIDKLFALKDERYAVMVVKDPIRYEWASVMLMNCSKCRQLTPEFVQTAEKLTELSWLDDEEIGELPATWNHLVGYNDPKDGEALIHYTQGVPAFPETRGCEYEKEWFDEHTKLNSFRSWTEIMAASTHSRWFAGGFLPKLARKLMVARIRSRTWYALSGRDAGGFHSLK